MIEKPIKGQATASWPVKLLARPDFHTFVLTITALVLATRFYLRYSLVSTLMLCVSIDGFLAGSWVLLAALCRTPWDLPWVVVDVVFAVVQAVGRWLSRGGKPRFPQWTNAFDLLQSVLHHLFTVHGYTMVKSANVQIVHDLSAWIGIKLSDASRVRHGTQLEVVKKNGLDHLWLRPESTKPRSQHRMVVLYIHGGGFAIFSPYVYLAFLDRFRTAIVNALQQDHSINKADVEVFMANYRKTPDHPYPVPQEDAFSMYKYLVTEEKIDPSCIILAGDSAGGGLVMSTMLRIRDSNLREPRAAILIHPFTDLEGAELTTRDKGTCMLSKSFVAACVDALQAKPNSDASSVTCDLHGLPPTFVISGDADLIYQDAVKVFHKAQQDGATDWQLDVFPNMLHDFVVFPGYLVPDSTDGIAHMATFAAAHFAKV